MIFNGKNSSESIQLSEEVELASLLLGVEQLALVQLKRGEEREEMRSEVAENSTQ